jgi:hypothetical protein
MVDKKNMNHEGREVTRRKPPEEPQDIGRVSFVNLSGLRGQDLD